MQPEIHTEFVYDLRPKPYDISNYVYCDSRREKFHCKPNNEPFAAFSKDMLTYRRFLKRLNGLAKLKSQSPLDCSVSGIPDPKSEIYH